MKAQLIKANNVVLAFCPLCRADTSFEPRQTAAPISGQYWYKNQPYSRLLNVFSQCARCGRGGLAVVLDEGNSATAVLESFYPISIETLPVPDDVPADILKEFREAERCLSFGANRAASALFRSVLEKILKANGYTETKDASLTNLKKRIDAAATDGAITAARKQQAHDDIRTLGNDVLHEDWREVTDDEVEDTHRYTQRILEDLYDHRPSVEKVLKQKGRLP
jgi:hypothetical protein